MRDLKNGQCIYHSESFEEKKLRFITCILGRRQIKIRCLQKISLRGHGHDLKRRRHDLSSKFSNFNFIFEM